MTTISDPAAFVTERPSVDVEEWARRTAKEGHWFDEAAAERAAAFFPRYLRHSKGKFAGKPFHLMPWQRAIVRVMFGWKNALGLRRFRLVFLEVPRKNGKTQLAAGIALYLAFADGEAGAEVYSVAVDEAQAMLCFNEAKRMRGASEALQQYTLAAAKAIFSPRTHSTYRPLSADAATKHGLNPSGVIYDEFHEFPDRDLFDVLHTGTAARAQPLEIIITTAGVGRHSIWWKTREHAIAVRDGVIDDAEFLPVLYGADPDDAIGDPRTWAKANPNLGVSVDVDYIAREAAKALQDPAAENAFKRLHLNIPTEQVTRWLAMEDWDRSGVAQSKGAEEQLLLAPPGGLREIPHGGGLRRDAEIAAHLIDVENYLAGRSCFGGLDLARVSDLTAFVLLFPPDHGDPFWYAVTRFWCPDDDIAKRAKQDRVPYPEWARAGFLTPTDGNTTDFTFVARDIIDLAGRFDIRSIAYDRTFAGEIIQTLMGEGLSLVQHGQGFLDMGSPTAEIGRMVRAGILHHGGHPILRWNAANVSVKIDPAGGIKPDKEKSTERIDGLVALIMARGASLKASPPDADIVKLIAEGRAIL